MEKKLMLVFKKFKGHYKKVVDLKKIGYMENDVMINAYAIWKANKGSDFTLKHTWQLLKNQPKWLDQVKETSSKRRKLFASKNYSSSSNLKASIKVSETDTPSRIPHPMGQKGSQEEDQREMSILFYTGIGLSCYERDNEGNKCCPKK